jgi:hypothetical protein
MALGSLENIATSDGIENIVNKTFYGLRIDGQSGKLYLDRLNGDTPVSIPKTNTTTEVGIKANDDYLQWFWSKSLVTLSWGDNATQYKNHLLMKVL